MSGATLNLSPYAAQSLSLEEERAIARRAVDLHARVYAIARNRPGFGEWSVRVVSWWTGRDGAPLGQIDHRAVGHLADVIERALDDFEAKYAWTPEELVQIAAQSGLPVRAA